MHGSDDTRNGSGDDYSSLHFHRERGKAEKPRASGALVVLLSLAGRQGRSSNRSARYCFCSAALRSGVLTEGRRHGRDDAETHVAVVRPHAGIDDRLSRSVGLRRDAIRHSGGGDAHQATIVASESTSA